MNAKQLPANMPAARTSIVNWITWPTLRPAYCYAVIRDMAGAEHRVRFTHRGGNGLVETYAFEGVDGYCGNLDPRTWAERFVRDDVFTLADNDAADRHAERRAEESRYWY